MNNVSSTTLAAAAAVLIVLVLIAATFFAKRKPKRLKTDYFVKKWAAIQQLCADKSTWPLAIIDADKLLDDALKRRKYKGKTMGERLVSAQRDITDNDSVWFAHKLRNRLVHEQTAPMKESIVKDALKGIRSALRDMGAL
jgi:hypothetical protein